MDPRQVAEHLRFYAELGVTGVSRDAAWRARSQGPKVRRSDGPEVQGAELGTAGPSDLGTLGPSDLGTFGPSDLGTVGPSGLGTVGPRTSWTLEEIREDIGDCTRCKLHTLGRRQVVFGAGSATADLMFVGEAPGADEDVQGVPFVGRAGQLLTKMIEAMGFGRDDVYIANVIKCRPPGNRNPEPDEVESCEPFLFRQIATIQPKVIVALGAYAAKALLQSQEPISKLRGRVYDFRGAKLIPTFHPSFLLRSPGQKKYAWEDLKTALAIMGRDVPRGAGDSNP